MGTSTSPIAIVGASAAGLYAATSLAEAGREVVVFEAAAEIPPAPRSLIVTSAYRDLLGDLGEPAIINEINEFELIADGHMTRVSLARPDVIIERALLIDNLSRRARAAGVDLRLGEGVADVESGFQGLEIMLRNGSTFNAGALIAADGARSITSRALGWQNPEVVPLVQALVDLPADLRADQSRVWFVPDDTPYFYWLIPDSETTGALGIIGQDGPVTRARLDGFIERSGLSVRAYQGARIPRYRRWLPAYKRLRGCPVYRVGDAAGHVKVTTVGGVVNGVWGAAGVVEHILHGSRRSLRALRLELGMHALIRRSLHHFSEDDYIELLDLLDSTTKATLGQITRDDTYRLMTSLLVRRPRLALLGLKGLFTGSLGQPLSAPRAEPAADSSRSNR